MQENPLDLIEFDSHNNLRIDGEKVTKEHFEFFIDMAHGMPWKEATAKHGISRATYYRLSEKDWWIKLHATYIRQAQERLTIGLSKLVPDMLKAAEEILKGTFKEPKMAGSAAKIIESFQRMGFKRGSIVVTPMQHSMRDLYVQDFSIVHHEENKVEIKIDELKNILSSDEMLDFAMHGKIPNHVMELLKQKAEDAEILPDNTEEKDG